MAIVLENYEDFEKFEHEYNNQGQEKASEEQISLIESLVSRANISHEERETTVTDSLNYNVVEAHDKIEYLMANQLDPITSGFSYSQTEIKKSINELNNK